MQSCLIDYVGVKGHCNTPPDSGIYINSYPGITMQGLNDISDADSLNWSGVWADIQARAIGSFELDVINQVSKFFKVEKVYKSISSGQYSINGSTTTATAGKKQGVLLQFGESKYLSCFVDTVKIYLQTDITFNLIIADAETGDALDTFAVTGTEGNNTILINKVYRLFGNSRRLAIYYDTDDVTEYRDTSTIDNRTGASSGGWSIIKGVQWDDTDADTYDNMTRSADTYGMIVNFALNCDVLSLVCQNKRLFLNSWIHLIGREIMTERLTSERINPYTIISEQEAERLYNYYSDKYNTYLKIAVKNVSNSSDKFCFVCDRPVSDKYYLP